MTKRKPQHGGGIPPSIPPSIANLEMIARARRAGLAQAMEDMLSEPHRPDPRDASVEEPQRLYRLRGPFFAALWELRIVEHIADLAQPPKDWRRQEFIDAVQRLIWVATVRVSVRHRARTKLDAKGMKNALAAVLRARDALQQLDGLVDTAPLEPLIADLSLWLGANPDRGASTGPARPRGSDKDWVFKWLVRELLSAARTFDAKLTLSKEAGEVRGSLSKVLVLLGPHLACIPRALPYPGRCPTRRWSASSPNIIARPLINFELLADDRGPPQGHTGNLTTKESGQWTKPVFRQN
jgi:hypothetical protein